MNSKKLDFSKLKLGPIGIGFAICIFSHTLMSVYFMDLVGLISAFIVAFILTFREGSQIDFEKKKIRSYTSLFGFKWGVWKDINSKYSIRPMANNKLYKVYSRASVVTRKDKPGMVVYESPDRRNRLVLGEFENRKEADRFAQEVRKSL